MKLVIIIIATLLCSCTPHQVQDLDNSNIDVKGRATYGQVGINDKDQAIVQVRKSAAVELQSQEMANYYFKEQIRHEVFSLHDCTIQMADPANGGGGEVAPVPAVDNMTVVAKIEEKLGLDEDGAYQIVTEEIFEEKLKAERKFQQELEQMLSSVKPLRQDCERRLGYILAAKKK